MKRKITSKLYEWKNMLSGRMPLLIYGARQVGKTFEMREFGALYYKNTIYVNFETDERIGKYFETDIHADHVISVLEKYYQAKIVPENTLIIFDEIQMCERALTSLKYFSEEAPEYHVMAAGSLLGVAVNREKYSFPVGKVQMLTMYPMDLEEVLWAKEKQMLADTIREHYENNQPLDEILHEEAMQEFYPIAAYQDVSAFKLYYSDMGIMSARLGMTLEALQGKEAEHFRGILTENYVAVALKTNGYDLHYWESDNTAEVDFLIQKDSHVIPVECKAGNHVKAKSMMVYMEKYTPVYAIRISARNFGQVKGIKSVPLYSAFCI